MTRIKRSLALLCLSALAALSIAVPTAMAATSSAAITPWEAISFNVNSTPNEAILIIAGSMPEGTKLPAKVQLAAPAGTELQWAGEILGGDAANDVEVTPVKTSRDGQDIYTFTLTKALTAQLEVKVVSPVIVDGTTYNVDFSATAWQDAPTAGVAVQIPAMARLSETPTGTAGLAPGPTGFQYYSQDFSNVKKGDVLHVAFSYTLGTGAVAPGASGSANSGSKLIVPILLVLLVAAMGIALVIGVRRKLNGAPRQTAGDARKARTTRPARVQVRESSMSEDAFLDDADAPVSRAQAPAEQIADPSDDDAAPAPEPRNRIALISTLAVVAVMVVAGIIAGTQGGQARATGGVISKTFSSGEACTNATIGLVVPENADTAQAAEQLFAALQTVPSITTAKVDPASASISVAFCDSQTNEAAIRAALAPTGLIAAGDASGAPAGTGGSVGASTTVE